MSKQMILKKSSLLFIVLILAICFNSCSNDNTITYGEESADAQIYSFSLSANAVNYADTINYAILASTKFAIDQSTRRIYNPDSLPYKINIKKFDTKMTFSPSSNPSSILLIYNNDSIAQWNSTDSIDYRNFNKFKITAAKVTSSREYTLELRIHQIDPDTIPWKQLPSLAINTNNQKTLLKEDALFYCYSISGSNLSLNVFDKKTSVWISKTITNPPSGINLASVTLFNDTFYAINSAGNTFSSTDGIAWSALSGNNVYSVLGVHPGKTDATNTLLVVVKNGTTYNFAKTKDMVTFDVVQNIVGAASNNVPSDFPASGFSSATQYDGERMLIITGGKDFNNIQKNTSWQIRSGDGGLEIIPTQQNNVFKANAGIATFIYDSKLYALTDNMFYISSSSGFKWIPAPAKQVLDPKMPKTSGQSIIVDKENYIWSFSGISGGPIQVWKGRLNKLNPKI